MKLGEQASRNGEEVRRQVLYVLQLEIVIEDLLGEGGETLIKSDEEC